MADATHYKLYRAMTSGGPFAQIEGSIAVTVYVDGGLAANTSYDYQLESCNDNGCSGRSREVSATTAPEPPSALTAMAQSDSAISITWSAVAGAAYYKLYRSTDGRLFDQIGENIAATVIVDSGLAANTSYEYRLESCNDNGCSGRSSVVSATTAPATPSALTVATQSEGAISITWSAVAGAAYYKLYRATVSGGSYTQVDGDIIATDYVDSGLDENVSYYYRLAACNDNGCSGRSSFVSATTAPATPLALTASAQSDSAISITWSAVADATHYKLYRAMTSGGSFTQIEGSIAVTVYVDSGLDANTSYEYQLESCNDNGCSGRSREVSATTAPEPPSALTAMAQSDSAISITWSAVAGAAYYKLYRSTDGRLFDQIGENIAATVIVDSGLAANTSYEYQLESCNDNGCSGRSSFVSATTAPATPSALTASAQSDSAISITWSAVAGAAYYKLYRSTDGGSFAQIGENIAATVTVDSGLAANTSYKYQLAACNGNGCSGRSSVVSAPTAPEPPLALTASAQSGSAISIIWSAVADATHYKLYRSTVGGSFAQIGGDIAATVTVDSGLAANTSYKYQLESCNDNGCSDRSAAVSATTALPPPPAPTATAQNASAISITWSAVADATHYKLYRATDGGSFDQIGERIAATVTVDSGLDANTLYKYQLESCNDNGCSGRSREVSATTALAPPSTATATAQSDSVISITWSAVVDATHYKLYRAMTSEGSFAQIEGSITVTVYVDNGLAVNTSYDYQLESCNDNGCSGRSSFVSATTAPATPPALTASAQSDSAISITWSAVAGATHYKLYRATGGGSFAQIGENIAATVTVDSGLVANTSYKYQLESCNDNGCSGRSREVSATTNLAPPPAPMAPMALTAMAQSDSAISIAWSAVAGATHYKLYRAAGGGSFDQIGENIAATVTVDSGLAANTSYKYQLESCNGNGCSDRSLEVSATTAPEPPSTATATAQSDSAISITWSAAAGATHYKLYRATDGGSFAQIGENIAATVTVDSGLDANTSYKYQLESCNGNGCSDRSLEVSATTAPEPPSTATATAQSDSAISITWSAVAGATHYKLYRATDGGSFAQIGENIAATVTVDSGLDANTSYKYQLESCNGNGCSDRSLEVSATTAPEPPSTAMATAQSASAISIAWSEAADATHYKLYRSTGGELFAQISGDIAATETVDSGLDANTSYKYQLESCNGNGCSDRSAAVSATTALAPPPAPMATAQSASAISIAWSEAADATHYKLYRSTGGELFAQISGDIAATVTVDSGLDANTSYKYQLESCNGNGCSDRSAAVSATTALAPPPAPMATTQSDSAISITWSVVADATHYKLYRSTGEGSFAQIGGDIVATVTVDSGLDANTSYKYQLESCNGNGCSDRSAAVSATTAPEPPMAPMALTAMAQSDSAISITWSAVADATHYKLYRSTASGESYTQVGGDITAASYVDSGLSANTSYYYQLEACNGEECSGRSPEVSAVTYAAVSFGKARDETRSSSLPVALAFSGGRAYVADRDGGNKIISYPVGADGVLGTRRDEITVGLSNLAALAFSGGRAYVVDGGSNDKIISYAVGADGVLGAGRNEITDGLSNPVAIAFSGGWAYVVEEVNSHRDKIISYPVGADGVLGVGRDEITTGLDTPRAIAFSGGRAYVADSGIVSYAVEAGGILGAGRDEITTGLDTPRAIAFSGGRAYVADSGFDNDKIVSYAVEADGSLGAMRDEITTGLSRLRVLAFSGKRAYVAEEFFSKIISYPLSRLSPPVAPDAPRVVAQSEIEIAWNAVLGATHYKLYRSATRDGSFEQVGGDISITRYRDGDLSANTYYYYRLEACNGDECSGHSPAAKTASAAPMAAAQSDSAISITWSAVAGATHYKLYRATVSGGPYMRIGEDITAIGYLDSGLSVKTAYYYQLDACNDSGCLGRSSEILAFTYGSLGASRDEAAGLPFPFAIAFSGGRAYVAEASNNKIVSYAVGMEGSLGVSRDEIMTGLDTPRAIAFSGGRAYVVDGSDDKIVSYAVGVEGSLGEGRDEITTDLSRPKALAFSGGRAYVARFGFDKIISYVVGADGSLSAGRGEITTGLSNPIALAFFGGRAYVADEGSNDKIVSYAVGADGSLGEARGEIAINYSSPTALAFSGGRAYVVIDNGDEIISYAVGADGRLGATARDEITIGLSRPTALAFSGRRAYVADSYFDKIISYPLFSPVPFAITPDAPRIVAQSDSEIAIAWNAVLGATHYKLYQSETSDGLFEQVGGDISITRYRDSGLSANTSYFYQLEACSGDECSGRSPEVSATTALAAPSVSTVAAQSDSEILITWSEVAGATYYKLYRSPTSGGAYTQIGGEIIATSYGDSPLSANTSYSYQLEACNGDGCSKRSPVGSATTALATPAAPTVAAQSDGAISITWSAVSGATHYKLYRSETLGGTYAQIGGKITAIGYLDSPLSASAPYYYQLEACNGDGCSGRSPKVSATTVPSKPLAPAAPTAATQNDSAISITWSKVARATHYKLYRSETPGGTYAQIGGNITVTVYVDSVLSASAPYYYQLEACNGGECSGRSPEVSATTALAAPSASTVATQSDSEISITWSEVAGATHYKLYRSETPGGTYAQIGGKITATVYLDSALSANTSYYYQLETCNGDGCSKRSPAGSSTTAIAMSAAPMVAAQSNSAISITWSEVAGATHYKLYRSETPGGAYAQIGGEITATVYLDSALSANTPYYYQLEACNGDKCSGRSPEVSAATRSLGASRDEITAGLVRPGGIAFSGGRVYVVDEDLDKIISYAVGADGSLGDKLDEITDGLLGPRGIAFSGGRAYVVDFGRFGKENKIISYPVEADGSLGTGRDEITAGLLEPRGIAFSGGRVYVTDEDLDKIISYAVRADGSLGASRDEITDGLGRPGGIAFSGGRAYVANTGFREVIISYPVEMGGELGAARDEITDGLSHPGGIAFSGGRAYVVDSILEKIISYPVGAGGILGVGRDEITDGLSFPNAIAFSGGRAYVSGGYVTDSAKITSYPFIQITSPVAPDAPRVAAQSGSEIEIAWNAVLGAAHYKLYRSETSGGMFASVGGDISVTRYRDSRLSANTFYYYQLVACNSVGCSDHSDGLMALAALVAAPQSYSEISITWNAVAGATHYKLYGSTSDGSYTQIGGEITAIGYLDGGLLARTAYHYQLEACNRVECSARSLEVSATTYGSLGEARDEITPGLRLPRAIAFSGGRAYVAHSGEIISYAVGAEGSLSEMRDEVISGVSGSRAIAFSGRRAYVVRNNNEIISYVVGADGIGEGVWRRRMAGLERARALAFSGGRAYVADVELGKIISYAVEVDGNLSEARDEITAEFFAPTGIAFSGGRAYVMDDFFRTIISYEVGIDGSLGEKLDEIRVTGGFSDLTAIAFSGGRVYVVGKNPSKIISYAVEVDGSLGDKLDEITDGLSDPTAIAFSGGRAYVTDDDFDKIFSYKIIPYPTLRILPPVVPDAPRAAAQSDSEIEIAWNAVLGATHYKLYWSETRGGTYTQVGGDISVTRYLDSNLSRNTFYYYQLEACNGNECSGRSPAVSALTDSRAPPTVPMRPGGRSQSDSEISILSYRRRMPATAMSVRNVRPKFWSPTRSAGEGVFHASGWVVGLDYQYGDGEAGKTGEKGAFPLRSGETVVFSTGQVTLGAVSIASDANADFFTPTRLGDQARAIRIERLLIALDSDGENDNGVVSLNAESASDALTAWNATRASDDEAATPINGRMRAIPSAATAATLLKRANNCGFSGAFAGRWTDAEGNGGEHAMVLLAFNEGDIDGVSNPRGVFAGIDQITGGNGKNGKALWIKLWNQGGGLQSAVTKYGAASGALSIDLSAFPVVATMTASNGVVMTITVESYGKIGYAVGGESGVLNRVRQEIPNADYRLAGFYSNDDRATPPGEQKPEIGIFAASIDGESEKLEPYIGRFLTDGAGVYSNIGHSKQDAAYTRQGTPADGTITIVAADGREIELRFIEQRDGVGYGAYEDTDANGDDGFDVFGGWCKL